MTTFAENNVNYPDGQVNVQPPPDSTIANGFIPEQAATRGQPLPAQWLNWALRTIFRYINRDKVSDATGSQLFPYANCMIRLDAIDTSDSTKYLYAIGFRNGLDAVHVLRVIQSNGLTLGTPTLDGTQPISGGSSVRCVGSSRQIGDL